MKVKFWLPAVLVLGAALSGCAVQGGYATRYGPPPPRYGVIGVAPGSGYVWTDGFWDWRGGRYAWVDGRWARPPHRGARWEPGRWEHRGRDYRFYRGHWR